MASVDFPNKAMLRGEAECKKKKKKKKEKKKKKTIATNTCEGARDVFILSNCKKTWWQNP
jgi:TPP-dependent indolepyruvate ferredoxin oxidoreductase alpha subunit